MEELSAQQRNTKAALYGVVAGVLYAIITTIALKQVDNLDQSRIIKAAGTILLFVVIGLCTVQIRKANGGYLSFKNAFSAIFIMILIATTLNFVANYIYIQYIDTNYAMHLKNATIAWLQKVKPEEVTKTSADFDRQIAESKKFSLGNNLMNLSMTILYNCLPGLLVGFIVKRNRPEMAK